MSCLHGGVEINSTNAHSRHNGYELNRTGTARLKLTSCLCGRVSGPKSRILLKDQYVQTETLKRNSWQRAKRLLNSFKKRRRDEHMVEKVGTAYVILSPTLHLLYASCCAIFETA